MSGPVCLYCMMHPLDPMDGGSGLCVSCEIALRHGLMEVIDLPNRGRVIRTKTATKSNPLGFEGVDEGRPYYPEFLFAAPEDLPRIAQCVSEFAVVLGEKIARRGASRNILSALRARGCAVSVTHGAARIDKPGRVPHALMRLFARYRIEIEELLDGNEIEAPPGDVSALFQDEGSEVPGAMLGVLLHAWREGTLPADE